MLQTSGFSMQAESLFICEGLTYYLGARSVDQLLAFARSAGAGNAALAFDYTVPLDAANIRELYGTEVFLQAMRDYHADEALMFAVPDGEIAAFMRARGLEIVEHYDSEGIEQAFLTYGQGALLGHVTGNFRFVVARAAPDAAA